MESLRTTRSLMRLLAAAIFMCATAAINAEPYIYFGGGQPVDVGTLRIYISDTVSSKKAAPSTYSISRKGNTYTVCVTRFLTGSGGATTDVVHMDVANAGVGDYSLVYKASNGNAEGWQPGCTEKAVQAFKILPLSDSMTSDLTEKAVLDNQVIPGWTRTGYDFSSFSNATVDTPNLVPVCRFYGLPEAGINSHFYSALASDCEIVRETWPDQWILESMDSFKVVPVKNYCPDPLMPVYRLYNNKPDANHRYTARDNVLLDMQAKGWILEGIAWCATAS